ncbi:MAG: hypothetical protein Q4F95_00410 [Oscillospiraceae bacterium]|nr:hypothetical protein [Oscillospiraceae bacterium]
MACFLVPAAEAVATTIASKVIKSHELKNEISNGFSKHLDRLNGFLWGGSVLLAFEHIWHGEITPFFPFLTKASDPADLSGMLYEMGTSGVAMAVSVTSIWAVITYVSVHADQKQKVLQGGLR